MKLLDCAAGCARHFAQQPTQADESSVSDCIHCDHDQRTVAHSMQCTTRSHYSDTRLLVGVTENLEICYVHIYARSLNVMTIFTKLQFEL